MSEPRVSVLVVSIGDSSALRACLQRVRDQARPLVAEVVLVINQARGATSLASARALAELADVVEHEPVVGKSHGLNRGVSVCRGEVVAFSDDDALPQPGWLEAITRPLLEPSRSPKLVGCGGLVRPTDPLGAPRWYRDLAGRRNTHFVGPKHDLGNEPSDYPKPRDSHWSAPIGANCAYRREVFGEYRFDVDLGPNRTTGLRGGEDLALGMRLLQDDYRIEYRPDAVVEHPVRPDRTTFEYVRRCYFVNGIEKIRLCRILGQRLPSRELLEAKLRKPDRRRVWRRILDPGGNVRRLLKRARMEGMLAEIRRDEIEARRSPGGPLQAGRGAASKFFEGPGFVPDSICPGPSSRS